MSVESGILRTRDGIAINIDFFERRDMVEIRALPGGASYIILYTKLLLLAVQSDGYLRYKGLKGSIEEELSDDLNEDEGKLRGTIKALIGHQLAVACGNGDYFLPEAAQDETDLFDRE